MPSTFVGGDGVAIKVTVIDDASAQIKTIKGNVQSLDKDLSSLTGKASKLDAGLKAFSWTTMAGGALNVSTALAQVYTSLSNLDRVQLQVKNSMVGVERAEDLLAKKTSMLNKEIEKNGSLSEKSIRLRNEIATATEDLANKEEKLKLAQDQVNDTYILFTTNIVNTAFGSIQTLAGMYAMLSQRKIADTVVTAINTGATKINNASRIENNITLGMQALANGGVTVANIANTASTWSLTVAMRALGTAVKANPLFLPATLATLAIGVGVTAYEMDNMAKQAKEAEQKLSVTASTVGMTSEEFSELSSIIGTGSAAMADYGSVVVDVSTKIEILNKALDDLQKKQDEINKNQGRRGNQNVKGFEEDIEKLDKEKKKLEEQKLAEIKVINTAIIAYSKGDIANILPQQIKDVDKLLQSINSMTNLYDDMAGSGDEFAQSLERSLGLSIENNEITQEQANLLRQIILNKREINSISQAGNRSEEDSLRIQEQSHRRIEEIKKNEIYLKHGIDVIEYSKKFPNLSESDRMNFDSQSNRGMVLNITGVDLGEIANP